MKLNDLINWVKGTRENCEKVIYNAWQEGNLEAWTFNRGKAEALEDVANMLTKVEQDLTLKELAEFCEKTVCRDCPFASFATNEDRKLRIAGCSVATPRYPFNIEEITQKVREVRK